MHAVAVILIALAGLLYCAAALRRWVLIAAESSGQSSWLVLLWSALALHTAALVVSLVEDGHRDFAYALLALWATLAALFFATRYLVAPSRALLVLPAGGMALLVALAGASRIGQDGQPAASTGWIVGVHVLFMGLHLAAMLVAAGAGGLWLFAVRRLRHPDASALALPPLPRTERLLERALVVSAALLTAGLATGGAAIRHSTAFTLAHPTALLGLLTLGLLVAVLALKAVRQVNRRGLALAAVGCAVLSGLGAASQLLVRHG